MSTHGNAHTAIHSGDIRIVENCPGLPEKKMFCGRVKWAADGDLCPRCYAIRYGKTSTAVVAENMLETVEDSKPSDDCPPEGKRGGRPPREDDGGPRPGSRSPSKPKSPKSPSRY